MKDRLSCIALYFLRFSFRNAKGKASACAESLLQRSQYNCRASFAYFCVDVELHPKTSNLAKEDLDL